MHCDYVCLFVSPALPESQKRDLRRILFLSSTATDDREESEKQCDSRGERERVCPSDQLHLSVAVVSNSRNRCKVLWAGKTSPKGSV